MTNNFARGRLLLAAGLILAALAETGRAEQDWSGPYVGVNGGFGWGQSSTAFDGDGDSDGLFGDGSGTVGEPPDGGFNQGLYRDVYGIYLGYNSPAWKHFVAGFEAAYNLTNLDAESKNPIASVNIPAGTTSEDIHIKSLFSLTPQVGYGWGRVLLRTKGGLAGGRLASHLANNLDNSGNDDPTEFGADQVRLGWTWGGGVDFALTSHWIAGLAFDYYDLGAFHFGGLAVPDTNWPLAYEVHPVLRTATFRLAYKFGGGAPAPTQQARVEPEAPATNDPHQAMILALTSGDDNIRAEAAVALGDMRALDAVDALVAALADKSLAVRGSAADALGKIGSKKAFAPLSSMLQDRQPKVRALAARALGALGDAEALPALRRLAAHDADPLVRRMANAAVKQLSQP